MKKIFTRILLFAGCALATTALPALAQTNWVPYFGNTHFGYSLGGLDSARMPSSVKLADLDNDGDLDAVVSHASTFFGFNDPSSGFYGFC